MVDAVWQTLHVLVSLVGARLGAPHVTCDLRCPDQKPPDALVIEVLREQLNRCGPRRLHGAPCTCSPCSPCTDLGSYIAFFIFFVAGAVFGHLLTRWASRRPPGASSSVSAPTASGPSASSRSAPATPASLRAIQA